MTQHRAHTYREESNILYPLWQTVWHTLTFLRAHCVPGKLKLSQLPLSQTKDAAATDPASVHLRARPANIFHAGKLSSARLLIFALFIVFTQTGNARQKQKQAKREKRTTKRAGKEERTEHKVQNALKGAVFIQPAACV